MQGGNLQTDVTAALYSKRNNFLHGQQVLSPELICFPGQLHVQESKQEINQVLSPTNYVKTKNLENIINYHLMDP